MILLRKKNGNSVVLSSIIPNKINCLYGSGTIIEIMIKTTTKIIDFIFLRGFSRSGIGCFLVAAGA